MFDTMERGGSRRSRRHESIPPLKLTRPAGEILAAYRRHNPRRRLDWRWQRAAELLHFGEKPDAVHDDGWTRRAFDYRRMAGDCPAESLACALPDIHAALQLHTHGGAPRWELQARILARETPEAIASKSGIASSVAECYEKLFFAVLDRIDNPTYIASQTLGDRPFAADDVAAVWNYSGYWHGPYLLDAVIEDFRRTGKPDYEHLLAGGDWWRSRSRFQRLLDRTIGLLFFHPKIENLTALLRLQRAVLLIARTDHSLRPDEGLQELIDEAIFDLFSRVSFGDASEDQSEERVA